MESWRLTWREGFGPILPAEGLEVLAVALRDDDPTLQHGLTTSPPPLLCTQDWPCEGADAIGYAGWKGDDLTTVGEVEEFFAKACFDADQLLGEPAACRFFLTFWDDAIRAEARAELLHEVKLSLLERKGILTRLCGPIPDGFTNRFVAANCGEATDYAVLADWLDENDRGPEAAMCRDAADTLFTESSRRPTSFSGVAHDQ